MTDEPWETRPDSALDEAAEGAAIVGITGPPLDGDALALLSLYRESLAPRHGAEDRVLARVREPAPRHAPARSRWLLTGALLAAAALVALVSRGLLTTLATPQVATQTLQAPFTAERPSPRAVSERAPEPEARPAVATKSRDELAAPEDVADAEVIDEGSRDEGAADGDDAAQGRRQPSLRARAPREPAAADERGSSPTEPAAPGGPSIAAELELIRAAERALRDGDFARALELAARHEKTFPEGQLYQEREASRISALCGLGGDERARATALRERFLARWPSSHLARRVRGACSERAP
ncbi:MAG: hypothetical protein H6713_33495 [Myxococcales bacterium]|nr:hypothetical protein [Myxococcales bacterium]